MFPVNVPLGVSCGLPLVCQIELRGSRPASINGNPRRTPYLPTENIAQVKASLWDGNRSNDAETVTDTETVFWNWGAIYLIL